MEYGLYNWWPKQSRPDKTMDEMFDLMIHPEDIHLANEINSVGKVFINSGREQRYIIIEFGENSIRVTPENWKTVPGDGFKVGDRVRVRVLSNKGKNNPKEGVVISMSWHQKNKSIIYSLCENGKKLKKQYQVSDIEKL
jgi:exosome complex RNA-binding protein Csl4